MAEAVRFELTVGLPTPVFKTGAFNRSATPPRGPMLNVSLHAGRATPRHRRS